MELFGKGQALVVGGNVRDREAGVSCSMSGGRANCSDAHTCERISERNLQGRTAI